MPQCESETQIPNVGFLAQVSLLPARIAKKHSKQPECNLSQNCRYGAAGETPTARLMHDPRDIRILRRERSSALSQCTGRGERSLHGTPVSALRDRLAHI